jgi:hypothetical protein
VANNGLGVEISIGEPLASAIPTLGIGFVFAEMRFRPHVFHECSKAFVEPDVAPVLAGDQITEPLVAEFVGDEAVLAGDVFGSELWMLQRIAGVRGGAGVFHAAGNEIIDHGLRVFFPRIVDAELRAEEFEHLGSAAVIDGEAVAAAFGSVVGDGHPAPGVLHFVEFAGDDGDQIGRARLGFFPRPGLHAVGGVGDADKFAVGDGEPVGGDSQNGFGGETIIRIVVSREVVACIFGFALRPDLLRAIGVILVGEDEIEAFSGLGLVADVDVEFFSSVRCGGQRDDELVVFGLEFGGRFIYGDALDCESRGIQNDFRGGIAENGERVSDIADDFFLIEIEAQRDAGMLQIVVAAASVGLVGAQL